MAVLGLIGVVLFFVLQPPSPHALYERAKKLMDSPNPDYEKAYADDGPIKTYMARYASIKNDETNRMLGWKKDCDVEECEQLLKGLLNREKKGLNSDPNSDMERDAKAAALAEEHGDLAEAVRLWQDMKQKYGEDAWAAVAGKHLAVDQSVFQREQELREKLDAFHAKAQEPSLASPADAQAYLALRYEDFGDLLTAKTSYSRIKDESGKSPDPRFWELYAAHKLKDLDAQPKPEDPHYRKALVQTALQKCEQLLMDGKPLEVRAIAMDVAALYGTDPDLKAEVKKARDIVKETGG